MKLPENDMLSVSSVVNVGSDGLLVGLCEEDDTSLLGLSVPKIESPISLNIGASAELLVISLSTNFGDSVGEGLKSTNKSYNIRRSRLSNLFVSSMFGSNTLGSRIFYF